MRYHVRNAQGEELVVPTLTDLHGLYSQGFLDDEDYVRAETSERWVKVGRMPALAGVRHRRREPRKLALLVIVVAAAVALAARLALVYWAGRGYRP